MNTSDAVSALVTGLYELEADNPNWWGALLEDLPRDTDISADRVRGAFMLLLYVMQEHSIPLIGLSKREAIREMHWRLPWIKPSKIWRIIDETVVLDEEDIVVEVKTVPLPTLIELFRSL
ncbi:MAG TPA: hypothetical protein PKD55_00045 [Bellilinea sp.]|nr:hypothetical protein [Bellilinea sp.]